MIDIQVNQQGRAFATGRSARLGAALLLLGGVWLGATGALAGPSVEPKVLEALASDTVRIRITAVVAVSKSGADNARPVLEAVLKSDKAPPVRAAAVEGLERLGDPAALPALERALRDESALVKKVAARAKATLEERRRALQRRAKLPKVPIDLSDVRDLSGAGLPGIADSLRRELAGAIEADTRRNWQLSHTPLKQGYGLLAKVRSIKPFAKDGVEGLEVVCDVTVVKLPGKIMRLSLTATAAAGVRGPLRADKRAEIVEDGVSACAPALAKDFLDYAFERSGP